MSQHHTKATAWAMEWCNKCYANTPHRIDDGRRGPCMECVNKLDVEREKRLAEPPVEKQGDLF